MRIRPALHLMVILTLAAHYAAVPHAVAELTHRYSFASDASDSVGGQHGILHGNAVVSLGAVEFDATAGTYVEFRIYEGTFPDDELAATFAVGPDQLPDLTPAPRLVVHLADGNVELSWSATDDNFELESSPSLEPAAAWTTVPGTPAIMDGSIRLSVPLSGDEAYYRLRQ